MRARASRERHDGRRRSSSTRASSATPPTSRSTRATRRATSRSAEAEGVDIVFAPPVDEVYPPGFDTTVSVGAVAGPLEGAARPGHFDGVATVVAILFALVGADRAYFGQKDAQQVMVIRRMARDLAIGTEVVACPTVREPDGLALSSRNVHLSAEERAAAPVLRRALLAAARRVGAPASDPPRRCGRRCGTSSPAEPLAEVDYVSVADGRTLDRARSDRRAGARFPRGPLRVDAADRQRAARRPGNRGAPTGVRRLTTPPDPEGQPMSTLSRSRTLAGLLAVAAVLALAVSPVAAKEGAIAKLETFVHRDAEPGSTIKVGWSTFMLTAGGEHPIHSTVETMRLAGPGGDSTEAIGIETPADSGHYLVSMTVPEGGIEQIQLSVRGDACIDTVGCDRVDYAFPLTDDALVSGTPVGIAKPAASVSPVTLDVAPSHGCHTSGAA